MANGAEMLVYGCDIDQDGVSLSRRLQ
jgi:hypothetical protein